MPAPPAPEVLPLPEVPIIPEIPHEDYGPPQLKYEPIPPPPPVFYAPYPAPIPITTVPPPPPPIPVFYAPYPAPVTTTEVPTTTTTPAPTTTVYYAPYPPPVVYTSPPAPITTTAPVTLRSAPYPYPSKTVSHYDSDSGLSSSAVSEGSFQNYVPIPAVRAPTHIVSSIKYVKPRIVISKKVIGFPKLFLKKRSIFKFFH